MERQVQESKKNFLQGLDVRSQREKLGAFISFCEDTIFEVTTHTYVHMYIRMYSR